MFVGLPLWYDIVLAYGDYQKNAMRLCLLLVPDLVPDDLITK
jgi:hypothetical protein